MHTLQNLFTTRPITLAMDPTIASSFPLNSLPGISSPSISPQPKLNKSPSTNSTDSSFCGEQGTYCFPSHPALNPLENVYLSLSQKTSSWGPHPAVRPLAIWTEKDLPLSSQAPPPSPDSPAYPTALPLALIILGVCLSVFIIALDRSIIATAIPAITAAFDSTDDIGWYGSAYLLTASAFQPLYGRIYGSFSVKASFLAALAVFELGSLICGVSPNSITLIVGRSIQGLGR
jgi:hypothetical protein